MKTCSLVVRAIGLMMVAAAATPVLGSFIPWTPLTSDSWVVTGSNTAASLQMHTVNGGDYLTGFDVAATSSTGYKARGMNALKFLYGGASTGHRAATSPTGTFGVQNTGGALTFRDMVVVVAINSTTLPAGFTFSLGVAGQTAYTFNPAADFGYYDPAGGATGRPSGYYSATSPASEPVAYSFSKGMVTAWAAQNVNVGPSGGTATFQYAFTGLPGTAVFSVYGYDANIGWMYHTNRGVIDNSQPSAAVSTFEVAPEPATLALAALGVAALVRRKVWPSAGRT